MKVRHLLCVVCASLLALPTLASAEIYKWRDKDGSVRYTDTPPPASAKQESISGKRLTKPTGKQPLAPVGDAAKPATPAAAKDSDKASKEGKEGKEDEAAKLRQKNADLEKKNNEVKEADTKQKAENCKAAKSNFETYKQGGRITKVTEKGERTYLDDNAINDGKSKAQKDMAENCN